jgi:hypothetical protein
MKLFVSWSQDTSRQIAQDFREWLPLVNQTIEPFMSEEDTDKGAHWSSTIRRDKPTIRKRSEVVGERGFISVAQYLICDVQALQPYCPA